MVPTPLLRPGEFFAERTPLRVAPAVGVVLLVAVATTAGTGLLGVLFAEQIEGTMTVDNENRPPDWLCEDSTGGSTGDSTDGTTGAADGTTDSGTAVSAESMLQEGCDEPKTREVSASKLLMDAFAERLPFVFLGPFLAWLAFAVVLHLLSGALGGSNGFGQTLAVAGWGLLPSILRTVVVLILGYFFVQGLSLSSDPEVLARQVESLRDTARSWPMVLVGLAEAAWQGYVWAHGLSHAREMNLGDAAMAAGLLAAAVFVFGLL